jgi:hypothetical protein
MNISQQGREIKARLDNFDQIENDPTLTEGQKQAAYDSLIADYKAWQHKFDNSQELISKLGGNPGDLGNAPRTSANKLEIATKGYDINPLTFDNTAIDKILKSMDEGNPIVGKTFINEVGKKAFNTVESLLPAQLNPNVVARIHEDRF